MTVVVIGEAVIDLVAAPSRPGTFIARPGGGPANTAVALARLGTPVAFAGRLAGDGFGRQLRRHLQANGVDLGCCVAAAEPTTLAVVAIDDAGSAEYAFYLQGTADWQWSVTDLPRLGDDVQAVHTGSLALAIDPGAGVLAHLLRTQRGRRTISVDPNVRPRVMGDPNSYRRRFESVLGSVDLVRASVEDLDWLYPGEGPAEVARRWRGLGPTLAVVTCGEAGALAFSDGSEISRPAPRVCVVDTIGAGDSFTAGLLDWLARHHRLGPGALDALTPTETAAALDFAGAVAAVTVSRAGADPPRGDEAASLRLDAGEAR